VKGPHCGRCRLHRSTIASACLDAGVTPVIVDNLATGRREFTRDRIFYEAHRER